MHALSNVIIGLLVFGVVVFVHEFGHFMAARWRGVPVDVFSIGFGPALCAWPDRYGTRWQLSLLPLGGYVKLHGAGVEENPPPPDEAARDAADPSSYQNQPLLTRVLVTVMGPAFNFLFAILLFILLYSLYGRPEIKPDIAMVAPQSAAAQAGLQKGDHLLSIDGRRILSVPDFQAAVAAHPGAHIVLGIARDGHDLDVPVTLQSVEEKGVAGKAHATGRLGIGFAVVRAKPMPFWKAIPAGIEETWHMTCQVVQTLWQMLTGQRNPDQLSGTIGIINMSGQAAHYGLAALLFFIAMLSANLGLLNLFPVPMLDGGHLLFYTIEAVRGRPISQRAQGYAFQAGLVLVLALFLFSNYNDLSRLGAFSWLTGHKG
ncbi:RIP metalloprotease RseP [Oecophyllibacter saccharovorans]|uniref:Zinc metalloprotease n=1 Tax=Oecophyllibacter saccharovorans TaxID=2558360 RepID=A0A506UQ35_9PROT|nr:RIP metalloprotease RseP [Oecophyllibacter saccharovorans]TPW35440.1 RIP metalloprotease RseP [Oecophyllibacter saccharovorans]